MTSEFPLPRPTQAHTSSKKVGNGYLGRDSEGSGVEALLLGTPICPSLHSMRILLRHLKNSIF